MLFTVLALTPLQLRAEDTSSRIPADALLYIQWEGADALGPAYKLSHTKPLVDAFGLPKLIQQFISDQASKETDPAKIADLQLVEDLVEVASKSTTTLYVGPVDFANPDLPVPKLAIFSNVGKERAADLAPKIRALYERQKDNTSPPLTSLQVGDYLVVSIGSDVEVDKRLAGPTPTDGLANTEAFKTAMAQLGPHPTDNATLIYLNAEAALKMMDDYVASRTTGTTNSWPIIEEALGITELKQIAVTGDFNNQDWTSQAFIGMSDKRAGLLGFLDNPSLNSEDYKLVPASAAWATLLHFDAAKLLEDLRDVAAQTGPRGTQEFNSALQQFYAFTNVDLKNDLFDPMGNTYAIYESPDATGRSLNALTFTSPLKNPQKFETALSTLESVANVMVTQRSNGSVPQVKTEPLDAPDDKIIAHILPLETFAPSWAISNGSLYVSTTKAGLQSAIDDAGKKGPITDNPAFKSLYKSLGQDPVSSFSFIDFPKVASEMDDAVAEAIKTQKAETPDSPITYKLPSATAINPNLSPGLRVSWTDVQGWHLKTVGPFPLSTNLGPQSFVMQTLINREEQHRAAKQAPAATPRITPDSGGNERAVYISTA